MISDKMLNNLKNGSMVRKMFEEGNRLKSIYGADNVYDFSIGNPDVEPPLKVKETLKKLVLEDEPGAHGYMSNAGYPDVRKKVADYINKTEGTDLGFQHVVMVVGAGGGLNVVFKTILNPGDEVIAISPFFMEYNFYVDNHGGKLVIVPANPETFMPDPEAIKTHINAKTKAIILNTPNNPTGVVYSEDVLKKIAEVIDAKEKEFGTEIYVISDEPYSKIVYDGVKVPSILRIFKNSIKVDSFSKSLSLPGERIGYVAAGSGIKDVDTLVAGFAFAVRTLGFVNAPAIFQRVIGEAIDAAVDVDAYRTRRDFFYKHLTDMGFSCIKPQGAFYLFPKSPIPDDAKFAEHAVKYNILLVPGSGFKCPGYFRLAYCVSFKTIENSLPAFEKLAKDFNLK